MPKHSIETLTKDVETFKRSTNNRFSELGKVLGAMQPQVQEMHDFIVDYKGFERGQATYRKDGSININRDVWGLLVKFALFAMAVAGANRLT